MVGLAGEGQNFDGNGSYIRGSFGGGANTIKFGTSKLTATARRRQRERGAARHEPALPEHAAAVQPHAPCYRQALPNVNGPQAGPGAGTAEHGHADAADRQTRHGTTHDDAGPSR